MRPNAYEKQFGEEESTQPNGYQKYKKLVSVNQQLAQKRLKMAEEIAEQEKEKKFKEIKKSIEKCDLKEGVKFVQKIKAQLESSHQNYQEVQQSGAQTAKYIEKLNQQLSLLNNELKQLELEKQRIQIARQNAQYQIVELEKQYAGIYSFEMHKSKGIVSVDEEFALGQDEGSSYNQIVIYLEQKIHAFDLSTQKLLQQIGQMQEQKVKVGKQLEQTSQLIKNIENGKQNLERLLAQISESRNSLKQREQTAEEMIQALFDKECAQIVAKTMPINQKYNAILRETISILRGTIQQIHFRQIMKIIEEILA